MQLRDQDSTSSWQKVDEVVTGQIIRHNRSFQSVGLRLKASEKEGYPCWTSTHTIGVNGSTREVPLAVDG